MEIIRYVLLANMLLAVVSVAYYVLLRRETFFSLNRLVLWLSVAGALLLPLLELPDWRPQPVRTVMHRTAQVIMPRVLPKLLPIQPEVTITFPNQKTYRVFQSQQSVFVWSWSLGLRVLYASGVLLLLIRFGTQLFSLQRLIQRSIHEVYDDFVLVKNERVVSPFSFFDWVVLNPDQHTPTELEQILRHERVHVRERHSLDMLGAELICIIFWFNPAAYLFRYLLQQTIEFYADRTVLAEGVNPKLYQYNLVKVSLAMSQSGATNHFSRSQLKSRIVMLNRPKSTRVSRLKYPAFCLAALTIASSFAHPHPIEEMERYVPQPILETITNRTNLPEQSVKNTPETLKLIENEAVKTSSNKAFMGESFTPKLESSPGSIDTLAKKDSARLSPSQYMHYEGGRLYWIVTPKTTFDDFGILRQEFAKHGYTMQLNEVKYDPLYAYINRISLSVVRPSKSGTNCDDLNDTSKPISSIAGYVTLSPTSGEMGTGGLRSYKQDFPKVLCKKADEDEKIVTQFIKEHRLAYLINEGNQKFKDLGNGSSTYSNVFFKGNTSTRSSGLLVNPDGSLAVDESLGPIKVFVNNESVDLQAVNTWKLNQLYSVVKKTQYNPARKESFVSALLIYTTEN